MNRPRGQSADTVLLTGFEAYGDLPDNPSARIVALLDGCEIAGLKLQGHTLPVVHRGLAARIATLIETARPRAVLGLGLCPGEATIRLERIAINRLDFDLADNAEELIIDEPIDPDGPDACVATLPLYDIRNRLLDAGIPARLSESAGRFLCNALMYHALRYCATLNPTPPCGFIHLPCLPDQIAWRIRQYRPTHEEQLASMALETQTKAVRLALETLLGTSAPA
ncbi:MAG: hypothetical protein R3202_08015 [Candidatus Competibacterales bacterium]|nr:hypothetical protein [Candidatus Competibacterales bacterium]